MRAPLPKNETQRLESLRRHQILDTLPEPGFDDLTRLASEICEVPIALISLVDEQRQWFKSRVGIDATETHRDLAFCAHAILTPDEPLLVPNATRDERFSDNPLVTDDPNIRFYLGVPLVNMENFPLGTLCVIDQVPRELTPHQIDAVQVLGRQVIAQIELRTKIGQMADMLEQVESVKTVLESSNRDLEDFAAVAAHDLKSPLRYIRNLSRMLREDCEDQLSSKGQSYLNRVSKAIGRMQRLLDDLMDYSLVTKAGRSIVEVDLTELVQEVVADLEMQIEEVGGRVDVHPLPRIEADATQMRQLFQNLIANAMKFHRDEVAPVVTIESLPIDDAEGFERDPGDIGAGPWCRVSVRDNGIGFDAKFSEQIFDSFKRLHTQQQYDGTGLGLGICKRVIDRHGGVIEARSQEGYGATFIITLPVVQQTHPQSTHDHLQNLPAA